MRNLDGLLELRPSLIGSLSVGLTSVGAPVDTMGFADVLAVLVAGAASGTNGQTGWLDVKIQESATAAGTGALWADIDDGALNGTFEFDQMTFLANTNPTIQMAKQYENVSTSGRKRFIRAHATVTGTDSCNVRYSVAMLLGRPNDTLYINNAVEANTTNVEYSLGL